MSINPGKVWKIRQGRVINGYLCKENAPFNHWAQDRHPHGRIEEMFGARGRSRESGKFLRSAARCIAIAIPSIASAR